MPFLLLTVHKTLNAFFSLSPTEEKVHFNFGTYWWHTNLKNENINEAYLQEQIKHFELFISNIFIKNHNLLRYEFQFT